MPDFTTRFYALAAQHDDLLRRARREGFTAEIDLKLEVIEVELMALGEAAEAAHYATAEG